MKNIPIEDFAFSRWSVHYHWAAEGLDLNEKKKVVFFVVGGCWRVGGLEGCRRRVLFSWGVSSRCPNQQLTLTRPSTWFTVTLHFIQTRSRHDLNFFWRTSRRKLHLDYFLTFYFLKFFFFVFNQKKKQNSKKTNVKSQLVDVVWCLLWYLPRGLLDPLAPLSRVCLRGLRAAG